MTHLLGHPTSPLGPPIYPLSLPSNPLRPHQSRANVRVHGCPVRGALQAWQQHGAAAAAAAHDDAAVCAGIAAAHAPGEVQHGACDPAVLVSATGAGRHGDRGARGRCACLDAQRHASPGRQLPPAPSGRRWAPRAHMCMFGACLVHVWCMFGACLVLCLKQLAACLGTYLYVCARVCSARNAALCTTPWCALACCVAFHSYVCIQAHTHTQVLPLACTRCVLRSAAGMPACTRCVLRSAAGMPACTRCVLRSAACMPAVLEVQGKPRAAVQQAGEGRCEHVSRPEAQGKGGCARCTQQWRCAVRCARRQRWPLPPCGG